MSCATNKFKHFSAELIFGLSCKLHLSRSEDLDYSLLLYAVLSFLYGDSADVTYSVQEETSMLQLLSPPTCRAEELFHCVSVSYCPVCDYHYVCLLCEHPLSVFSPWHGALFLFKWSNCKTHNGMDLLPGK